MHSYRWAVYLHGFWEVVLVIVKVLSADHILLEERFERLAQDRLTDVLTSGEKLQNQDQDRFHWPFTQQCNQRSNGMALSIASCSA
jgi:hypothetical protein